jgi:hypothetical protein
MELLFFRWIQFDRAAIRDQISCLVRSSSSVDITNIIETIIDHPGIIEDPIAGTLEQSPSIQGSDLQKIEINVKTRSGILLTGEDQIERGQTGLA